MESGSIADWVAVAIAFLSLLVFLIVERRTINLAFYRFSRRPKKEKPEGDKTSEDINLETKTIPIDTDKKRVLSHTPTNEFKVSKKAVDSFIIEAEFRTVLFLIHAFVGFLWGAILGAMGNSNFLEGLQNGLIIFGAIGGAAGIIVGAYLGLSRKSILASIGLSFAFFNFGMLPGGLIGAIVGAIFGLLRIESAWIGGLCGIGLTVPLSELTTLLAWIAFELISSFKESNN